MVFKLADKKTYEIFRENKIFDETLKISPIKFLKYYCLKKRK